MGPINIDFKGLFYVAIIVSAVIGWAVIELVIWLFSHITIGIV